MEKGVCKCGGLTAGKHHNFDDEDNYDQVDHGDNDLDVDGDDDPGNGFLCGPDSDADGFPDESLDCEERWNKKYQKNCICAWKYIYMYTNWSWKLSSEKSDF